MKNLIKLATYDALEIAQALSSDNKMPLQNEAFDGAEYQAKKMMPLIIDLAEVAMLTKLAIEKMKTQKCLWPADMDALENSLMHLESKHV